MENQKIIEKLFTLKKAYEYVKQDFHILAFKKFITKEEMENFKSEKTLFEHYKKLCIDSVNHRKINKESWRLLCKSSPEVRIFNDVGEKLLAGGDVSKSFQTWLGHYFTLCRHVYLVDPENLVNDPSNHKLILDPNEIVRVFDYHLSATIIFLHIDHYNKLMPLIEKRVKAHVQYELSKIFDAFEAKEFLKIPFDKILEFYEASKQRKVLTEETDNILKTSQTKTKRKI